MFVTNCLLSYRWDRFADACECSIWDAPNRQQVRACARPGLPIGTTDPGRKHLDYSVCGRIPAGPRRGRAPGVPPGTPAAGCAAVTGGPDVRTSNLIPPWASLSELSCPPRRWPTSARSIVMDCVSMRCQTAASTMSDVLVLAAV